MVFLEYPSRVQTLKWSMYRVINQIQMSLTRWASIILFLVLKVGNYLKIPYIHKQLIKMQLAKLYMTEKNTYYMAQAMHCCQSGWMTRIRVKKKRKKRRILYMYVCIAEMIICHSYLWLNEEKSEWMNPVWTNVIIKKLSKILGCMGLAEKPRLEPSALAFSYPEPSQSPYWAATIGPAGLGLNRPCLAWPSALSRARDNPKSGVLPNFSFKRGGSRWVHLPVSVWGNHQRSRRLAEEGKRPTNRILVIYIVSGLLTTTAKVSLALPKYIRSQFHMSNPHELSLHQPLNPFSQR